MYLKGFFFFNTITFIIWYQFPSWCEQDEGTISFLISKENHKKISKF